MKNIAVFLANGFEEIEALTVVDICRRAGLNTTMVSVEETDVVKGAHDINVVADKMFDEVNFDCLDMLVLPGGMPGTKNLASHKGLIEQIERFYQEGRHLAAICAAPSILGQLGLLKGRKACCYPGFEEQLTGAEVSQEPVEQSEHVITARGMGTAIPFSLAIVALFCGQEKAEELAQAIIYNI